MVKKWLFIFLSLLIGLTFVLNFNCHSTAKDVNIVLIVVDALRADHLPFYGYPKNTAPFLNQIAQESVLFNNAFSASSWTPPAMASIFTSLYPFQHGVNLGLFGMTEKENEEGFSVSKIPQQCLTLPEMLKKEGYVTIGVSDNLNIGSNQGFNQGFDLLLTSSYRSAPEINKTIKKMKDKFLSKKKYFLYIHYMEPHAPYNQRKPFYKPAQDFRQDSIAAYDSEIHYVDAHIKELYQLLQWDKNTFLIVTADHGEELWDHGRMTHGGSLHRELLHVPLLIKSVNLKKRRIPANVSNIDIYPTMREMIGLPQDKNLSGVSLMPLIKQKKNRLDERFIFSYLLMKWPVKEQILFLEFRSVIHKAWHYQVMMPKRKQLFNLAFDPKEIKNLIKKAPRIAQYLNKEFVSFYRSCPKYSAEQAPFKMDENKRKHLRTLGYIQ